MKKDLILYHGSNKAVPNPSVNKSKMTNDFGNGFYLTADRDQAIKWAKRKAGRCSNTKCLLLVRC